MTEKKNGGRAGSWTGPALAWPLWPGSSEVQGQGHNIYGPDIEGQVQVRKKSPRPGPDRTLDMSQKTIFSYHVVSHVMMPLTNNKYDNTY